MAKQIEECPEVVVKNGFPRNEERRRMKPGRLERMTHHVSLQIQQIHCRIFEEAIPVSGRCAEIPKVGNHKKQEPEKKECCLRLYQGLETGRQVALTWQKGKYQKGHAE